MIKITKLCNSISDATLLHYKRKTRQISHFILFLWWFPDFFRYSFVFCCRTRTSEATKDLSALKDDAKLKFLSFFSLFTSREALNIIVGYVAARNEEKNYKTSRSRNNQSHVQRSCSIGEWKGSFGCTINIKNFRFRSDTKISQHTTLSSIEFNFNFHSRAPLRQFFCCFMLKSDNFHINEPFYVSNEWM